MWSSGYRFRVQTPSLLRPPLSGYTKPGVQHGLEGNVRITASIRGFCQHLLPLTVEASNALHAIHEEMKQQFWKAGRWANFPTEEDDQEKYTRDESLYHQSFVELANAVGRACTRFGLINDDCVQGIWVARPNHQSCENGSPDSFKTKPDIVHITKETTFEALDADLAKALESDPTKQALEARMTRAWWSQVRTPIEITSKPPDGTAMNKAVLQLCSYMLQVVGNQFDRRFTIGMVVCGEQLSLWLCDKTGIVGTLEPIHIHKDTMEFIQVLVALKIQPAYRLGWDPTMKVYQMPRNGCPCEPIPSYRIVPNRADFASDTYPANWVISMPTKDGPSQREDFVTIRKPIKVHTDVVECRGTIVWEVVRRKDIDKPGRQIFILKQYWQSLNTDGDFSRDWRREKNRERPREAKMYDQAGIGDRICSAEILGDETASTLKLRGDLNGLPLYDAVRERNRKFKVSDNEPMAKPESGDTVKQCLEPHILLSNSRSSKYDIFHVSTGCEIRYEERGQARLLMVNLGLYLPRFLDLLELLRTVRGAVKDHEKMYFSGILHRDISIGNIILVPKETSSNGNNDEEDCGKLIDLGGARRALEYRDIVIHGPPSEEQCTELEQHFISSVKFDRDVLVHAWRYHGEVPATTKFLESLRYSRHGAIKTKRDSDNSESGPTGTENLPTITMQQLGWETRHQWRPDPRPVFFGPWEHPDPVGTVPFMSAHVASWWPSQWKGPIWQQSVANDMESFLWVINSICMSYRGPGGERRQGVDSEDTKIYKIVHQVFKGNPQQTAYVRRELMTDWQYFEELILDNFDPYFDPLKGMVEKWYRIQERIYTWKSEEGDHIHAHIKAILDETIEELKKTPSAEEYPRPDRLKKQLEELHAAVRNLVPDQARQTNRKLGTNFDVDEDSEPPKKKIRSSVISGSQGNGKENNANEDKYPGI